MAAQDEDDLNVGVHLDAAARRHEEQDAAAIRATAFRLMLQKTFIKRFRDEDDRYFIASLTGLSTLFLAKSGPLDGNDIVFVSRLTPRAMPMLLNKAGGLRGDIALRLYQCCADILAGAAALQKEQPTARVDALQKALRGLIDQVRAIDAQAGVFLPPRFRGRRADADGERISAFAFFTRHWAWRAQFGEVFLDDLKAADPLLYRALAQHQHRRGKKLSDLIPLSPTRGRKKNIRTPAEQTQERRRANRERMRRYRKALQSKSGQSND